MANHLVLQSDFGQQDGAVSTMYGVAYSVSDDLVVSDLTHGITPFNIFEGSFRLAQTIKYWAAGTVFVSVVDPGVGSNRLSIVVKLVSGHYVVTPDNGTLTHLAQAYGIVAVRQIDESVNRLAGSEKSATFHGRDIYAYTGARLAAGIITFEEVGPLYDTEKIVTLPLNLPEYHDDILTGNIDITDVNFGSLWTNIHEDLWTGEFKATLGDWFNVKIYHRGVLQAQEKLQYVKTFADVNPGDALIYINSVYTVGFAIHTGDFAKQNHVSAGPDWSVEIQHL
ncbi:S-adenosyl-l-methionine hydroxide adenosyltransferase family protein [Weissella diestrammenae]|uniref:S-adenosyl-l-methionine hydroxide adenosyltransferase family protein n=1 Tax=Weissella diestrammenae TaxID=1162633 RepID=A0A7G9T6Z9_9LACO|nr:S-adenosyl-l-methionine hydroxide adenosyltransferase family protein [Weissella diestrammenae]MCM0582529.1 S-adenosyl-l-methionine hydroxide adenosyltransferase family protein [Weissella diestrammenae]QNN75874.1 S-adenosyl-l-methionine hydroxide adenosyltransferase family protein [Weissella diestrammenae]